MGGDGGCHPNGRKFMQGTMATEESREKSKALEALRDEQRIIRTRTCCQFPHGRPGQVPRISLPCDGH